MPMPGKPKERFVCSLEECGKEFWKYRSWTQGERVFCGVPCVRRQRSLDVLPMQNRQEAAQRYLAGELVKVMAKEYQVAASTLMSAIRGLGVTETVAYRSGWSGRVAAQGLPADEGDLETGHRWCLTCRKRKPMTVFYRHPSGRGRKRHCGPCYGLRGRRQANLRANRRKHLYGLTEPQFRAMWQGQEGRCAICPTALVDDAKGVHVDHCHETGKVRGLLCSPCNTGLGHFKDDPEKLRSAAAYLERTRS